MVQIDDSAAFHFFTIPNGRQIHSAKDIVSCYVWKDASPRPGTLLLITSLAKNVERNNRAYQNQIIEVPLIIFINIALVRQNQR